MPSRTATPPPGEPRAVDRRAARPLVRSMFGRHRRSLVVGYLLAISHQTCEALVPVAAGLVIGNAVATGDVAAILLGVAGILLLFAVLASSAAYGYYVIGKAALIEAHRQRVAAVRHVLTDPSATRNRQAGELLSITSSDTRATTQLMETVGGLIASGVGLAVATVVLLRIDVTLGIGLLVALAVLVGIVQLLGPYLERRLTARQQAVGLAAAVANDLLTGLRSLRGFGGVAEGILRYRGASRTSLTATVRATTSTAVVTGVSAVATGVLVVLTAAVAAQYALAGTISIADLVTVIGMATFLLDPVSHITRAVRDLAVTRASSHRVAELLGGATTATDAVDATRTAARRPDTFGLDAVADGPIAPIDLALAPGELLGVVTADVATADALAELVGGARPAAQGAVRLGGDDLATLPDRDLRAAVLAEPHTVHLLGGSLADALDTGAGGRGEVDVATALAAAAVRVEDLAGHGGSAVGSGDDATAGLAAVALLDHGANLSGGQRQRIALARALRADRDVLVLRDPTSAVDAVTEDEIAAGLHGLRAGRRRTIVFTTSPLLLGRCDRVLFVDADGSSTLGPHAELQQLEPYREVVLR